MKLWVSKFNDSDNLISHRVNTQKLNVYTILSVNFIQIDCGYDMVNPIMLIFASLPILFFGTYQPGIEFPFFGAVRLNIIYPILILIAITVTANTMNTIDVLNGTVSGFTMITTTALLIALILT